MTEQTILAPYETKQQIDEFWRDVVAGTVTIDQFREAFERVVASATMLEQHYQGLTVAELKKTLRTFWRDTKKNALVKQAVGEEITRFAAPYGSYQIAGGMSLGGDFDARRIDAVRFVVDHKTDQSTLDAWLTEQRASVEARRQTLTDPQTIDQFETFVRFRGTDHLTRDQRLRWDLLVAEHTLVQQVNDMAYKAQVAAVDLGQSGFRMIEGWHSKHNCKLWTVQLTGPRVAKETFDLLATKARQLDGRWSSFGPTSTHGFQFRLQEQAERFMSLQTGAVDNSDAIADRQELGRQLAADKLTGLAQSMTERAEQKLNGDRKVNTARRAAMAASVEADARRQIAMGATVARIAEAVRTGTVRFLTNVSAVTHVEALDAVLQQAKWQRSQALGERWEQCRERPMVDEDVDFARYPFPRGTYARLEQIAKQAAKVSGLKLVAARLLKHLIDLFQLAKRKDPEVTGETSVDITSAIFIEPLRSCFFGLGDTKYDYLTEQFARYDRLQKIGLVNEQILRVALREYLTLRSAPEKPDPLVEKERELVGRKIPGFFPTPPALVTQMITKADLAAGQRVLEPSAGKGDIAEGIFAACPDATIECCEVVGCLRELLQLKGFELIGSDFLEVKGNSYDRIIMNPPFENGADIDHVRHAYSLLKADGRLVTIMSAGTFNRNDRQACEFRQWLDTVSHEVAQLPDGSFSGSDAFRQTGVSTVLVTVDR